MDIFNAFDNIFGGVSFHLDGNTYDTHENIFGGEDIYENGRFVASTHENIFDGHDVFDSNNELIVSTKSNIFGGHDIFSSHGGYEGYTHDGIFGTEFVDVGGHDSFSIFESGNATTILGYSNPLDHVGSYVMPTLIL